MLRDRIAQGCRCSEIARAEAEGGNESDGRQPLRRSDAPLRRRPSRHGVVRGLAAGLLAGAAGLLRLDAAGAARCREFGRLCREGANCCDGGGVRGRDGRKRCCTAPGNTCDHPSHCRGESRCGLVGNNPMDEGVCCLPLSVARDPSDDNVCCNAHGFQPECGGVGPKAVCCIPDGEECGGSGRSPGGFVDNACCSGICAEGVRVSTCEAPGASCNRDQQILCCEGFCRDGACRAPSGTACDDGNGPICCNGACTNGLCGVFPDDACDDVNGPSCCLGACVSGFCVADP